MFRSRRKIIGFIFALVISFCLFAWFRNRPKVIGHLPRKDLAAIKSALAQENTGLAAAVRRSSLDLFSEWVLNHREGQLVLLQVQSPDQVFAFLRTTEPSQASLIILDRSPNGWRISGTNNSVALK